MYTTVTKEDLIHKGNETADDMKNGARRIRDDIRGAAGTVKEDLQDIAHKAGRHVREVADSAEENLVSKIKENPLSATGIALAAGFIVGLIFRR